jgi:hypothetical protein
MMFPVNSTRLEKMMTLVNFLRVEQKQIVEETVSPKKTTRVELMQILEEMMTLVKFQRLERIKIIQVTVFLVKSLMIEQTQLNFQMHSSNLFQKSQMFWKETMHW